MDELKCPSCGADLKEVLQAVSVPQVEVVVTPSVVADVVTPSEEVTPEVAPDAQ